MTTISDLIDRWNTDEGKPYKGSLIDMNAYQAAPDSIGCMCAQGQVLHLVGGWSQDRLHNEGQAVADAETAKLLNISRAHAVLLRVVNDKASGAPSIVLTDPAQVIGDKWSAVLDLWHHLDGLTIKQWAAARAAARAAAGDAAWDAAWDAAGATAEIQGADVMRAKGQKVFFLPAFGFSDPAEIPARPSDYGIR